MDKLQGTYREILKIALPLMAGNLAYTLISVTDVAFVGFVKPDDLAQTWQAAIGYASTFYLIFFMVGYSYTKGTQIWIARRVGEGKPSRVGFIVDNTIMLLLIMGLLMFAFFFFLSGPILDIFLRSDDVLNSCVNYLKLRSFGLFFSFFGSALIAYYTGVGRPIFLMVGIISMAAINIFLNWVFIFGNLGAPELGILGAALASVIAEFASLTILLTYAYFNKGFKKYKAFKYWKWDGNLIKRLTDTSAPLAAQSLIGLAAWFAFFSFIEKMGEFELAISNVIRMIYLMVAIPTYAFASSVNTVISNVLGQGRIDEVRVVLRRIIALSLLFTGAFCLVAGVFPEFFLGFFTRDASQVLASVSPLRIALVSVAIYSVSTIYFNCIVATGATRYSLMIEVITIVLYMAYLFLIFSLPNITVTLAWTGEWVYWGLLGLFAFIYVRWSGWERRFSLFSSRS